MKRFVMALFVSGLALSAVACSSDVKKAANTLPPIGGEQGGGEEGKKEEPKRVTIQLGEIVDTMKTLSGKEEEGKFQYEGIYAFELTEETQLRIRKDFSNGNCGKEDVAVWQVTKEDGSDVGSVAIMKEKEYSGIPTENFEAPLPAGKYHLNQVVVMPSKCDFFFYDFVLEKAPTE